MFMPSTVRASGAAGLKISDRGLWVGLHRVHSARDAVDVSVALGHQAGHMVRTFPH
jgi:hypothetical protein